MGGARPAGEFTAWLTAIAPALRGDGVSDVPCGTCVACCRSSQFVHVGPDETDALAHIPAAMLFPAPGRPPGHLVMGYDERGWCPMLSDSGCSIYEHRPQTCRSYDCRVFVAAGVRPDATLQPELARRAQEWEFATAGDGDGIQLGAIRAASRFLGERSAELPAELRPPNPTAIAVLAIEIRGLFVHGDPTVAELTSAIAALDR